MFQPTRPFVRWSSVLSRRAHANGGSYVVENVMPKPRCRVTVAIADSSTDWLKTRFACAASLRPAAWATRATVPTPSICVSARITKLTVPALLTPAFWLMLAYTALVYPIQAGISLHMAPHLIEHGIDPAIVATIVSAYSLAMVGKSVSWRVAAATYATVAFLGVLAGLATPYILRLTAPS